MRDVILTLLVFGALPWMFARPYIGILFWSWLGYMNPHRLTWSFAYNFPFAQVVAIATLLGFIFSKEPKRLPLNGVSIVMILFLLWMGVTTTVAILPNEAFLQYQKVIKIFLITFLIMAIMGSRERVNMMVWVIVVSIGFFSVKGGLFTIAKGGSHLVYGPGGFIGENNAMAMVTLMVLPLMFYLRTQMKKLWAKHAFSLAILLSCFSVAGSHSRGAFLGAGLLLIYVWLHGRKKILGGVLLVCVAVAVLSFMPDKWHDRMESISEYEQDSSAMGRINAWRTAFNLASDRVTGGGFEHWGPLSFRMYSPDPTDIHDAHSIFFEVLGEHGFPGLGLFLLLLFLSWRTANRIIRRSRGHEDLSWAEMLSKCIKASLVAYMGAGSFLGLAYFDLLYHLIAILFLCDLLVARAVEQPSGQAAARPPDPGFAGQTNRTLQGRPPAPGGARYPAADYRRGLPGPSR